MQPGCSPGASARLRPCREVWRREGEAVVAAALRTLVDVGCSLFIFLDVSPELLKRRTHGGALQPKYVDEMPVDWQGRAQVFATEDGGAFEWSVLLDCLEVLCRHLATSRAPQNAAYVHCFGGHGRAGIIGACLLGLVFGWDAATALAQVQLRHDAREDPAWPLEEPQPSPQTDIQRVQVEMFIDAMQDA